MPFSNIRITQYSTFIFHIVNYKFELSISSSNEILAATYSLEFESDVCDSFSDDDSVSSDSVFSDSASSDSGWTTGSNYRKYHQHLMMGVSTHFDRYSMCTILLP